MAYIILVEQDNSLYGSHKERIMQRSTGIDSLIFVVDPMYKNEHDMTTATVMLEYLLPVSKLYKTEYLVLSSERYNNHYLQYKLPLNTKLTSEAGRVELQLTFVYTDLDASGKGIQKVRKTSTTYIDIIPISAWSDIIPDAALSSLDQRILVLDAQMRGLNEYMNVVNSNAADNLVYNAADDTLQLYANGVGIGNKVSVKDMIDDGIPVVDLDDNQNEKPEDGDNDNDGNNCNCEDCNCENDDNVVEF